MNKVILAGRLTKDPDVRYGQDGNAIARYTLAVDRMKEGTDFPNCVAFGKAGEFAEKYLCKGMKILVEGRINTSSYTNKEGKKIYTTEVFVDRHEFCERKSETTNLPGVEISDMEFMDIPEGLEDELPFV